MSASGYVHLECCRIHAVTESAILVEWDGGDGGYGEKFWFPKSQVADPDVFEAGDKDVTVSITEWIAKQKGIDA